MNRRSFFATLFGAIAAPFAAKGLASVPPELDLSGTAGIDDLVLSLDYFNERYLEPAVMAIANRADFYCSQFGQPMRVRFDPARLPA